ncbi:MAG: type II toxin-antitoxin system VapC family toxin [Acidobacteria bacterium]|nr:type II toxin-antitoxin system VapC family toxin [Acidobacteriota bacterium]
MIRFFDASALVKRYIAEEHSATVEQWFSSGTAFSSRLSEVEIASALARRCRDGDITAKERDQILGRLYDDLERALYVVELQPAVLQAAVVLIKRHPLRSGDAIQLASALSLRRAGAASPVEFAVFDGKLSTAAQAEGLEVLAP